MSLRVKTARGSLTMGAALFLVRPLSFAFAIVLLRLLQPSDFGTVALGMILVNSANIFTDLGMRSAIIRWNGKADIERVTFYAFTIAMISSILFYALVFFYADDFAQLLGGEANLIPVLRVLGLIIIIDGLWVIPEGLLKRDLRFKNLAIIQLSAETTSSLTAIALALNGFGLWSLVIGNIMAEVMRVLLTWTFNWTAFHKLAWLRPHRFEEEPVRELLRFGTTDTASGLVRYFTEQVDTWYVGRNFGETVVGYYSKAYDMTSRLTFMFSNVLFGQVLLPSYAKIQDDLKRLQRAYLKSTSMVMLTMAPVSLGLLVLAEPIIKVLFGAKWLPMVPIWQVFSFYTLVRPISGNTGPLFQAVGRPGRNLRSTLVLLAVIVPSLLILVPRMGIVGAAVAVFIGHFAGMLFNVWQINEILPGTGIGTFKAILPSLICGAIMALVVQLAKAPVIGLAGGQNWISLLTLVVIGALAYLGALLVLQRPLLKELVGLTVEVLGLKKRFPRLASPRAGK